MFAAPRTQPQTASRLLPALRAFRQASLSLRRLDGRVPYRNVRSPGSKYEIELNESSESRSWLNTNSLIEQFRTRQFTSAKLRSGAPSADCTSTPIGPPDVNN